MGRNICHGSDSVESANHEIALWFKPEELCNWTSAQKDWIYEFGVWGVIRVTDDNSSKIRQSNV